MRRAVLTLSLLLLVPLTGVGDPGIEESIEQRQAAYKALKGEVKKFKEAMQAKAAAGSAGIVAPAEKIVQHSKSLLGTFVEGSYL